MKKRVVIIASALLLVERGADATWVGLLADVIAIGRFVDLASLIKDLHFYHGIAGNIVF
jgi:riboflavin transporter FmnP